MRTRLIAIAAALLLTSASVVSAQSQISPSGHLFSPTNPQIYGQIDFGGRVSSIDGDKARYQRYRDLRDGVYVDIPLFHRENDDWVMDLQVRNAGYRDQSYSFAADRLGRGDFYFFYDQTPTYISADTRTPYSPYPTDSFFYGSYGGTLDLPDDVQLGVENGTLDLRTEMERLASGQRFDSGIRRDSLGLGGTVSAGNWDIALRYLNTKKEGSIPWGASFAFGLAVEIPLPIDSRTNDFGLSAEWANDKGMFRVGWDGSWFDNRNNVYVWDSPRKLNDSTNSRAYSTGDGTSRGRATQWPTNTYNAFNVGGAYKLPGRSNLNGAFSYGTWHQDEALPPHTINTAIDVIPLSRTTAEGEANTTSFVLNFLNRQSRYVGFNARYRYYKFDNKTHHFELHRADGSHDEYVRLDQVPEPFSDPDIHKVGSEPFGYTRNYFDVDASFSGIPYSSIRIGYGYYGADLHFRVFEKVTDNTFRISYDAVGNAYVSFRSLYERSKRSGDLGTDVNNNGVVDVLEGAGEQPGMRHFDIADRTRDRFTLLASLMPTELVAFNASVAWTKDDFANAQEPAEDWFGVHEYSSKTFTLGLDAYPRDGVSFGASYAYDDYGALNQERTASPGAQFEDPNRNWTTDEDSTGHSFLVNLDLLKVARNTELRFDYVYTKYTGSYVYAVGSALPTPEQLPDITSQESRFGVDLRYFLRQNVAIGVAYWYNDYQVEDWAFSPDIFTGVAQPPVRPDDSPASVTAVLLNYYYRPFTAHTGWLRLTYLW